jgi:hypothetical protein
MLPVSFEAAESMLIDNIEELIFPVFEYEYLGVFENKCIFQGGESNKELFFKKKQRKSCHCACRYTVKKVNNFFVPGRDVTNHCQSLPGRE